MRRRSTGHKRHLRALVILASALAAAGARAEDGAGGVDTVLKMMNLKTDAGRAPDFVEAARPKATGDYMSVGTQHPERSIKVKTPAELKASVAELDAARVHQDKISGRKQPADGAAKVKPTRKTPETRAAGMQN